MLIGNLDVSDALVNAAQGQVRDFITKIEKTESNITAVLVNFHNSRAGSGA